MPQAGDSSDEEYFSTEEYPEDPTGVCHTVNNHTFFCQLVKCKTLHVCIVVDIDMLCSWVDTEIMQTLYFCDVKHWGALTWYFIWFQPDGEENQPVNLAARQECVREYSLQ